MLTVISAVILQIKLLLLKIFANTNLPHFYSLFYLGYYWSSSKLMFQSGHLIYQVCIICIPEK